MPSIEPVAATDVFNAYNELATICVGKCHANLLNGRAASGSRFLFPELGLLAVNELEGILWFYRSVRHALSRSVTRGERRVDQRLGRRLHLSEVFRALE